MLLKPGMLEFIRYHFIRKCSKFMEGEKTLTVPELEVKLHSANVMSGIRMTVTVS